MKSLGIVSLVGVIITILYFIGAPTKKHLQKVGGGDAPSGWIYCWRTVDTSPEISGEGKAFNLNFGENGEIFSFLVKWEKGETVYSRSPAESKGKCSPKNGWWTLKKLSRSNEYAGVGVNKEGQRIETFLFIPEPVLDLAKLLGPDWGNWKEIILTPKEWTQSFKTRNGSDWKVLKGKVWVRAGNNTPLLDKVGGNLFVSGGGLRFYPETEDAILFFKY